MRDCKGIKILLVICPSSHWGENLLPHPEVFWNLWLSHVSFLLSLFLLSQFQHARLLVTSIVLGFLCVWLPQCELLPSWASVVLGFFLTGAELMLLHPGYIQVMAADMLGKCVISSVLSCHSKDLKWCTRVTAQFYSAKQRKVHPWGMRAGWPQRQGVNPSWLPLFICFVSSPLSLPYANWASQEGGMFCFTWSSHYGPRIFFCSIFVGFSLSLSLATTILDSFLLL